MMTKLTRRLEREISTSDGPFVVSLVALPEGDGGVRIEVRRKRGRRRLAVTLPSIPQFARRRQHQGELACWLPHRPPAAGAADGKGAAT